MESRRPESGQAFSAADGCGEPSLPPAATIRGRCNKDRHRGALSDRALPLTASYPRRSRLLFLTIGQLAVPIKKSKHRRLVGGAAMLTLSLSASISGPNYLPFIRFRSR